MATARLSHAKRFPRASMSADEVRRVLDVAAGFDPAAALALRIAAVAGARRAELAALRWSDLTGARLTIDSATSLILAYEEASGKTCEPSWTTSLEPAQRLDNPR